MKLCLMCAGYLRLGMMVMKKNKYHVEYLGQDLLGDWVLVRQWGTVSDSADQHVLTKVTSYRAGRAEIKQARNIRKLISY